MNSPLAAAPPAAPPPPKPGIPRLIYLARILWLCFFPVLTVLVGNFVLLWVDQAREALVAFNDANRQTQQIAFWIAYILWMISAWYVARLLLGKRFEPDLIGECSSQGFAAHLGRYLPRILALVAGLPIPIVLLIKQPRLGVLALVLFISCVVVFVVLVFRRPIAVQSNQKWIRHWTIRRHEDFEHFDTLSGSAWAFIALLFILSVALWLAIPWGMAAVARPLGAPTLLLLALMSWTLFGGFVLTYLPRSFGYPAFTWIPLILLLGFSSWNENHPVALPTAVHNAPLKEVRDVFKRWLHQRPDPSAPVIFVASAGGASRAAYWTTSALGMLEDEARGAQKPGEPARKFADNIFVISSVSGGSLGAATFVATLDLTRHLDDRAPSECRSVRQAADRFTGNDHLSTILGLMLFPDLFQRILPAPANVWDRSRGLEEVWARDWDDLLRHCGTTAEALKNPWTEALTALAERSADPAHPLPELALNSTALALGQQVLQARFKLPRPDVFDVLGPNLATVSLTLSQAVHNSARFPYVSPGGVVRLKSGEVWDRLGDGGYVEASGALMLGQILQVLTQQGLIKDAGNPSGCAQSEQDCFIRRDQIRILILDNTPSYGHDYLCRISPPSVVRRAATENDPEAGKTVWPPGPDLEMPLIGAFSPRGGRALSAEVDVSTWAGGCTSHFAELRLPVPRAGEEAPSMNWMLDRASRDQIDAVLSNPGTSNANPDPNALLGQNLEIVRSWF
jgi:hypothetical protein